MLDVIIKNGKLIDGEGRPSYRADIGIADGKIVKISPALECEAAQILDADNLSVAPGFVDIHTHSDIPIAIDQRAQSKVQQGVTTELTGHCGSSAAPAVGGAEARVREEMARYDSEHKLKWQHMHSYLAYLEKAKPSNNQAILAGHGTLRAAVFGYEQREPSAKELSEMKALLIECMQAGAYGISTGLYYAPGSYANTDEVIEMCKVAARLGGVHCCHLRDESDYNIGLIAALEEAIEISRASGVSTQIAHLKALGPRQWGKGVQLLQMIEQAREEGLDVSFDQYPYPASGSSITGALLPRWAQEGGRQGTIAMLKSPDTRKKIFDSMVENLDRRGGADRLVIASYTPDRTLQGKSLEQVAQDMSVHPVEAAMRLLEEAEASFVSFVMSEEDVDTIMKHPVGMVGSDGSCLAADGPLSHTKPHPRHYGTFPRVLGKYARERRIIPLEEAVRKMTSAPAKKIGLLGRGVLREGYWADVCVFSAEQVEDRATFEQPQQYPEGIKWVLVNGVVVVEDQKHKGVFPGHVLRKKC